MAQFKKPNEVAKTNEVKNGSPKVEPIITPQAEPAKIEVAKDIVDDIEVTDMSLDKTQRFNYLIHCHICQWQGRTLFKENALQMRENHKLRHLWQKAQP